MSFTYGNSLVFFTGKGIYTCPDFQFEAKNLFNKMNVSASEGNTQSGELEWIQITSIEDDIFLGGLPYPTSDGLPIKNEDWESPSEFKSPHSLIEDYNIDTVISVIEYLVKWNLKSTTKHFYFIVDDQESEPIIKIFDYVSQIIHETRSKKEKVFIHCRMGVSRSVTLLAAYYLRYGLPGNVKSSVEEVLNFIRKKRSFVNPNVGFLAQLLHYEKILKERKN